MHPYRFFKEHLEPRISVSVIPAIYEDVNFGGSSGGWLRGPCPLHGGVKNNFCVSEENGAYSCKSKCADKNGSVLKYLNGGVDPSSDQLESLVIELARRMGVDHSMLDSDSNQYRPRKLKAPVVKPRAKKRARDLTELLLDTLQGTTKEAREYLYQRLPGEGMKLFIDAMIESGALIAPPLVDDAHNSAGIFHRARYQGYHLAVPVWDVENSNMIASAAMRSVIPELKPAEMEKAVCYNGPRGGEYGGTMGQLHKALEEAEEAGCLLIAEGITDFLTLEVLGFKNKVGLVGNDPRKLIKFLLKKGWKGRIVALIDNDEGSDQSHFNAGKLCAGTSIEYCDGRPPRDIDLTAYFVMSNGGGEGYRAIQALIKNAEPYAPDEAHDRIGQDRKAKQEELLASLKETWGPQRKYIQQIVAEDRRKKLEHEKRESARQASLDLKAPAKALFELWKKSEKGDDAAILVLRLLLTDASDLSAAAVEKLAELAELPDHAELIRKAAADPIENAGREVVVRKLLRASPGHKALAFFAALARALGAPLAQYLHLIGFNFSPHRGDKPFMEFVATHKNPVHAKKIRANRNCSEYHREHHLKDTGEHVRTIFTPCGSQICTFCWGYYLAQQDAWLRKTNGWKGKFVIGFARSDTNTPAAVTQTWEESLPLLRDIPVRGALRPAFPDLGLLAGTLFVARHTEQSKAAFDSFLDDVRVVDGAEALSEFTLSLSLVPLLFQSLVVRHDDQLGYFAWLNRCQLGRRRGRCDFEWRPIRNWKEFKKELDGVSVDERPQWISHYHSDSGILIHEEDSEECPLLFHEVLKKASENMDLQEWLDEFYHQQLPGTLSRLLNDKRRDLRERFQGLYSRQ